MLYFCRSTTKFLSLFDDQMDKNLFKFVFESWKLEQEGEVELEKTLDLTATKVTQLVRFYSEIPKVLTSFSRLVVFHCIQINGLALAEREFLS